MKYSIKGSLKTDNGSDVVSVINKYTMWRFFSDQVTDDDGFVLFAFEAWLNNVVDKDTLLTELIPFVDLYTGEINWHECTHDETPPQPCVISESYVR